jgi:hypothetical protein
MRKPVLGLILALILIIFISGCTQQLTGQSITEQQSETLVTKSTSELLPTRNDLSTEWRFYEVENITVNFTGFDLGSSMTLSLGVSSGRNSITPIIYKFLTIEQADSFYENKINSDNYLEKGGYKEVNTDQIAAKCQAYKVDKIMAELGQMYCVKANIFFELKVSSQTFESDKYLIDIGKIIVEKID